MLQAAGAVVGGVGAHPGSVGGLVWRIQGDHDDARVPACVGVSVDLQVIVWLSLAGCALRRECACAG